MVKKIIFILVIVFTITLMVGCQENTININTTTTITSSDNTTTVSSNSIQLPDLTGFSKRDIMDKLDDLGINYLIQYETNTDLDEDVFIRYDGDDQIGDSITDSHLVIIKIATSKLVLPDLSGKDQLQIFSALSALNIQFTTEVVTDNTVVDQTFSSYGDGFVAGDLVSKNYIVIVNIGYNSPKLPDLTGMMKEEIETVLNSENIAYQFSYVTNDDYAEDLFANYVDNEAGDFYIEGVINVVLYKNTFTDNTTSLIISKYVDGGDLTSDQAIEIYNPSDTAYDLSEYYLSIYTNGSFDMSYKINFDDINLLPGETYVIANSNANNNILVKADLITDSLVFDGNDTIQLCYQNGTYIDTIYNLGNRDYVMDNEVFVRNSNVVKGERNYVFGQWNAYVPSYVEILGTHPIEMEYEMDINIVDRSFHDPLGGMDLVSLMGVADGDTAYFDPGFMGDARVRFIGVDTPETYPTVDPWGPEAKEYTKYILNHGIHFYIQSDPDLGFTGNYGRSLGLVWVDLGPDVLIIDILNSNGDVMRTEHLSGWILLNYHLVLNGYSYNYYSEDSKLVFDHKYIYRWFQEAERYAAEHGLGVHE